MVRKYKNKEFYNIIFIRFYLIKIGMPGLPGEKG
jgi:hypothetical protein